jgi:hypothetical protein
VLLWRMNELKVNAGNRQNDRELEVGHTSQEKIQGRRNPIMHIVIVVVRTDIIYVALLF